jgi:carboxyl-terminal processing protease
VRSDGRAWHRRSDESRRARGTAAVALVLALAVVLAIGGPGRAEDVYRQLGLLTEVLKDITTQYVDEVPESQLIRDALVGLLGALPGDNELLEPPAGPAVDHGEADVGLVITRRHGTLTVVAALDGSPARRAGLAAGDRLLKIDGLDTTLMGRAEAAGRLRGEAGTTVTVTVLRAGQGAPADLRLTRERPAGPAVVTRALDDGVRYLRVRRFTPATSAELARALTARPGRGLVLDLRDVPDGSVRDAVDLARWFLPPGRLVASRRGRHPDAAREFRTPAGGAPLDVPLAVLVNGGSAAAAEIVAGALQDWHRAVLVGTRTFGEADDESIITLPDGARLRLTTARWATPSGAVIDGRGITPDVEVDAGAGGDVQLQRALEVLRIGRVLTTWRSRDFS